MTVTPLKWAGILFAAGFLLGVLAYDLQMRAPDTVNGTSIAIMGSGMSLFFGAGCIRMVESLDLAHRLFG
jgi:hypothetical protein